jgi:hypothetical protein
MAIRVEVSAGLRPRTASRTRDRRRLKGGCWNLKTRATGEEDGEPADKDSKSPEVWQR